MFDINKSISEKAKKIKFGEFKELILEAYNAKKAEGFKFFDGKKNNSLIHVGPVDYPVTKEDVLMKETLKIMVDYVLLLNNKKLGPIHLDGLAQKSEKNLKASRKSTLSP